MVREVAKTLQGLGPFTWILPTTVRIEVLKVGNEGFHQHALLALRPMPDCCLAYLNKRRKLLLLVESICHLNSFLARGHILIKEGILMASVPSLKTFETLAWPARRPTVYSPLKTFRNRPSPIALDQSVVPSDALFSRAAERGRFFICNLSLFNDAFTASMSFPRPGVCNFFCSDRTACSMSFPLKPFSPDSAKSILMLRTACAGTLLSRNGFSGSLFGG